MAYVDINAEIDFHKKHGKLITTLTARESRRFWALGLQDEVNGDQTVWEAEALLTGALKGEPADNKNYFFGRPIPILRDKLYLEELWKSGKSP